VRELAAVGAAGYDKAVVSNRDHPAAAA
jgi:hypothetical protein